MSVLTVSNATKSFGGVTALAGASFELEAGELLALLGPNGAGKTTLIRAIAGRVRLDGGEIRLFGQVLSGGQTPPELGIVPQEVALYPLLTARENLQAFGRLQGLSGKRTRRAGRLGARAHRPRGSRRGADQPVLRRHAPPPQHRLRHRASAAHRAPRRADRRRRSAEPRPHLRHARRPARDGRVAAADDASSRRGRSALLAHGHHRSRQGDRGGHVVGARRSDGRPPSPRHAAPRRAVRRRSRSRGTARSRSMPPIRASDARA